MTFSLRVTFTRKSLKVLSERTGLEPATPGVTGRYFIRRGCGGPLITNSVITIVITSQDMDRCPGSPGPKADMPVMEGY